MFFGSWALHFVAMIFHILAMSYFQKRHRLMEREKNGEHLDSYREPVKLDI